MIAAILIGGPHHGLVLDVDDDCFGFLLLEGGYAQAPGQQHRRGRAFRWHGPDVPARPAAGRALPTVRPSSWVAA